MTDQSRQEESNTTLKREGTRWKIDWRLSRMIADSLRFNLKLAGSRITDKRKQTAYSAAYRSTTAHRTAGFTLDYRHKKHLSLTGEIGYDDDSYDRPGDEIQSNDRGRYMKGELAFQMSRNDQLESELLFSAYRSYRDIRRNVERKVRGSIDYWSWSAIPNAAWEFEFFYSEYDFPGSGGIERRTIRLADHQCTLSGSPLSGIVYEGAAHYRHNSADYDSVSYVVGINRKDYERTQYDLNGSLRFRWKDRAFVSLSGLIDWQDRDYNRSHINDLETFRRRAAGRIVYEFAQSDTLLFTGTYELLQHTCPDSNSRSDRDVVNWGGSASWAHHFLGSFRYHFKANIIETHLINLSRFSSAGNHRSISYKLSSRLIYQRMTGLTLKQSLELDANYIIYDFPTLNAGDPLQESKINLNDQLIRRFSYISEARFDFGQYFELKLAYRYEPQDHGGYRYSLPENERFYQPNREQLTDVLTARLKYRIDPALTVEPFYSFQESRLWGLSGSDRLPISKREQQNIGLRLRYNTKSVHLQAYLNRIVRRYLPNYWLTECVMTLYFP
ncbi:MAG: hypothetical protein B6244_12850 [Candidatus Cloacimonetes bacterium 4572_55]|nr:MAG: hypothetical protein B6244_12850 [Candidatus Cloacimonetes bacterium 4572_55]